ncbi:MAG: hypothetical protein U5J78_06370 [Parasphingorhabdus sp.]|nr:hypothetical protein [Parasphingorhabdus sp.]
MRNLAAAFSHAVRAAAPFQALEVSLKPTACLNLMPVRRIPVIAGAGAAVILRPKRNETCLILVVAIGFDIKLFKLFAKLIFIHYWWFKAIRPSSSTSLESSMTASCVAIMDYLNFVTTVRHHRWPTLK